MPDDGSGVELEFVLERESAAAAVAKAAADDRPAAVASQRGVEVVGPSSFSSLWLLLGGGGLALLAVLWVRRPRPQQRMRKLARAAAAR